MKNKFVFIFLLVFVMMPFKLKAENINTTAITDVSISAVSEHEVGDYFDVTFKVSFSPLSKTSESVNGIYTVVIRIDYDTTVLDIINITSDWYDSGVYKDGENYYIIATIATIPLESQCVDEFLACSDYSATLRFYVKNDSKTSTDIKILETGAGTFKVDKTLNYSVENMQEIELIKVVTQPIKIKKSEKEVVKEPEKNIVVEEQKPTIKNEAIEKAKENSSPSNNTNTGKSSNTNLSSITIENYPIKFKKDQYHYDITVNQDIKSLNIKVTTEDKKATYKVIGNDDLKEEVKIVVKAEDGKEATYTIQIKRKEEMAPKEEKTNSKEEKNDTVKNVMIILGIAFGVIAVIVIICLLVSHHNNKKLDKMLNNQL